MDKIIDGSNQILGRLSSRIAKNLLNGERIIIINAEKVIITGKQKNIVERFKIKRRRGNPHHGPYYPKTPNGILKRSIRGMLPYKKAKGRDSMRRLNVYVGNPKKLSAEKEKGKEIECNFITLEEISRKLGGL